MNIWTSMLVRFFESNLKPFQMVLFTLQNYSCLTCYLQIKLISIILLLPPASEGWGKVLLSVCQSHLDRGDTPSGWWGEEVPHPRSGGGGTPSCWWGGGWVVSHPRSERGYPILLMGKYPIQNQDRGPIETGWGTSPSRRQISVASTYYAAGGVSLVVHARGLSCYYKKGEKSVIFHVI